MKKNGKKWRKLQKEAAERRAIAEARAGEPFSKAKTRKKFCCHYDGWGGGPLPGFYHSKLVPLGEKECVCKECGKVFPIEKYEQMERLIKYELNRGNVYDDDRDSDLYEGLEPVYYRRISENEIEILETPKN